MNRQKGKVLVVGAGISGLSAAVFLARDGFEVEIWEAEDRPGGLLSPVLFNKQFFDKGSHRIHPTAEASLFSLFKDTTWLHRPRRGHLIMGGRSIPYPPTVTGMLLAMKPWQSLQMVMDYCLNFSKRGSIKHWEHDKRRFSSSDESYEKFVIKRVGKVAYKRFYEPYALKVWGMSPAKLSCSMAKRRVSTARPASTLLSFGSPAKGISHHFLYPKGGMPGLSASLLTMTRSHPIDIKLGQKATLNNIGSGDFQAVFATAPLTELAPNLRKGLGYRGLYLLYITVAADAAKNADTFYTPELDYWFGRVSRPDLFSGSNPTPKTVTLCIEIPEGNWGAQTNFIDKATIICDQLYNAGILTRPTRPTAMKQLFLKHVYPIYTLGWQRDWQSASTELLKRDKRIYLIGRQGLFLHCNMDHCVSISKQAAAHLNNEHNALSWLQQTHRFQAMEVRD